MRGTDQVLAQHRTEWLVRQAGAWRAAKSRGRRVPSPSIEHEDPRWGLCFSSL